LSDWKKGGFGDKLKRVLLIALLVDLIN
jgi:hypothetical protein